MIITSLKTEGGREAYENSATIAGTWNGLFETWVHPETPISLRFYCILCLFMAIQNTRNNQQSLYADVSNSPGLLPLFPEEKCMEDALKTGLFFWKCLRWFALESIRAVTVQENQN